jgi:drug/metabolite transporter (DMT)-like permease
MTSYVLYALLAAIGISAYAILTKVILRYRLCSAAYVAFATGATSAVPCIIGLTILGPRPPQEVFLPLLVATVTGFFALYAASRAMQEGDPSTVVPVMGMKIPFVAVMSVILLGEVHPWQTYLAAGLAFVGVILFGIGPQQKAQGGHGYHPAIGILWATLSAALYALSDIYIRRCLAYMSPVTAAMWNYTFIGLLCLLALSQPGFRQYRVTWLDFGLLSLNGIFLLLAVMAFFVSISQAGQVTAPNIIFAIRSFIILAAGYALNRLLKTSIERQPNSVYALRVVAATLLFAAILITL